jgi:hypothetical protein
MWLVNTFVGDLNQNQLIGHIQEMASFIVFSLIHLLAFFRSKGWICIVVWSLKSLKLKTLVLSLKYLLDPNYPNINLGIFETTYEFIKG